MQGRIPLDHGGSFLSTGKANKFKFNFKLEYQKIVTLLKSLSLTLCNTCANLNTKHFHSESGIKSLSLSSWLYLCDNV